MELPFDTMLYFNMGNENSDVGHIKCPQGHIWPMGPALG